MSSSTGTRRRGVISFVLCAAWLSVTVAFFAMVTSGGEANMELAIGPWLQFQGTTALAFSRGMTGFGLLMLGLLFWRRRAGLILATVWSVGWAALLSTAILSPSGPSEVVVLLIVIALLVASARFAVVRLRQMRSPESR
jgi:hypothetical protein